MRIDTHLGDLSGAAERAVALEQAGFDGLMSVETQHDPFLPLVVAAEHTRRVDLITGIAVAFARNPMTLANVGHDLQEYSKGRFILGLGSQIRPHIEKRFSMTWSHPAPRMRELISAVRAIWEAWDTGSKLDFRGDFYTHTLMTPFFNPGPNPHGNPRIFVAAVGAAMTEAAAEVADGIILHAFTNERYLREVTLPAVERGLARSGRRREDFELSLPCFVISGEEQADVDALRSAVRAQIAFYGSTPAYRPALEVHGWGDLQGELNTLSKQGRWAEMAELVDGSVLDAFAVQGAPDDIPERLLARFGDIVDRLSFYAFPSGGAGGWARIVDGLRRGTVRSGT
ncbi:MAG: putative F420-dependent oxidoreductase, family [Chloroflexi bacterium]|nr:putative F420-dependent oxidoreductase, family [Chloroflexota bacterium]